MDDSQEYKIHDLIKSRWSPRAMSGEVISKEELMPLFEAARWAPSSYNAQPWRFLYIEKDTKLWKPIFSLLTEKNQAWIGNASHLVVIFSRKAFEKNSQPSITHSFDTGSAFENLMLEACSRKIVAHGLQGFDYQKCRELLAVPDVYALEAMIALGKPGKVEVLNEDLQKVEKPKNRKPLQEIASDSTEILK